ncbi:hypothetical protein C1646_741855 [Rhizophagus diaphanus]|nr:hypothetical protein C1646_741855 [Rhizophagus diaphanus] [Rhizophagus sp. MUCL 43196]
MATEIVTVIKTDSTEKDKSANLNLNDKLSKVREILEQNSAVRMNDMLLFVDKNSEVVERKEEGNIQLNEVVEKKIDIQSNEVKLYLYLKNIPLEKLLLKKLNFGRSITENKFEIANMQAFNIKGGLEGCTIENIEGKEEKIGLLLDNIKLLLTKDVDDVQDLEINGSGKSTYTVIECRKVTLCFKLEPTEVFIKTVKKALYSEKSRRDKKKELREITDKFGQFISEEIILGGRAYFKKPNILNKLFRNRNNYSKLKSVGGRNFNHGEFNKSDWLKSLRNYENWDCIKVKDPKSIFKLLPKELYKQILLIVGKKILCTYTKNYDYQLSKSKSKPYKILKIPIPNDILVILQENDHKYNIFATIVDKKGVNNDIFNCQILWSDEIDSSGKKEDQQLIIHCFRRSTQHEYKLKVKFMIIDNDVDFKSKFHIEVKQNEIFSKRNEIVDKDNTILELEEDNNSHCFGIPVLKNLDTPLIIGHHFFKEGKKIGVHIFPYSKEDKYKAKLPDFTFYTLIIYQEQESPKLLRFQYTKISKLSDFTKEPKFISLYSTSENKIGYVFLRQKINEIKIKYIDIDDERRKLHNLDRNLNCAIFDPPGCLSASFSEN